MVTHMAPREPYMVLVEEFRLKPITTPESYEKALSIAQKLMVRDEKDLTEGELDYLDALSLFIKEYEDAHHKLDLSNLEPRDVLQHLMQTREMSTADLGRVIGSPSAASMLVTGGREPSKRQIKLLADFFRVDPGLFLGVMDEVNSGRLRGVEISMEPYKWTPTGAAEICWFGSQRRPRVEVHPSVATNENFEYRLAS